MNLELVPTAADLREIAGQVWESYLDPEGVAPLVIKDVNDSHSEVSAAVSISGSWHGHVVVSCTLVAAKHAAAAFLAMEVDEVSDDDITDVMGEMANIVGGNVKSMLPAGSFVSLPHVVVGSADATRWPAAVKICELSGYWKDEPISINMWRRDESRER